MSPTITARSRVCIPPTWNRGPVISVTSCADLVHLVRKLARDVQRHVQAGQHGAMRQDDGFRLARRARGEDDEGGLFLVARGCPHRRAQRCPAWARCRWPRDRIAHPAGILSAARASARMRAGCSAASAVGHFGSAPPGVGEDGHRAGAQAGPEIDDPLGAVPAEDEDAVAALRRRKLGELAGLGGDGVAQVLERDDALALHDVRPRAPALGEREQVSRPCAAARCTSGTARRRSLPRRSDCPKLLLPMT